MYESEYCKHWKRQRKNTVNERTDHLNRVFGSEGAMALRWRIPIDIYEYRYYELGMSKEASLTSPVTLDEVNIEATDYAGTHFVSKEAMVEAYHIEYTTYKNRRARGFTKYQALLKGKSNKFTEKELSDRDNVIREMVKKAETKLKKNMRRKDTDVEVKLKLEEEYRKIDEARAELERLNKRIEQAKEKLGETNNKAEVRVKHSPIEKKTSTNDYNTIVSLQKKRMAEQKKIKEQKVNSIKNLIEKAEDHKGNKFSSTDEMCKIYGISTEKFGERIKNNWSIREALETGNNWNAAHMGIFFESYDSDESLAKAYNIEYTTMMYKKIKDTWSPEQILGLRGASLRSRVGTCWNGIKILYVEEGEVGENARITISDRENKIMTVRGGLRLAKICLGAGK